MLTETTIAESGEKAAGDCCAPSCCGGGQASEAGSRGAMATATLGAAELTEKVRQRYSRIAEVGEPGCGCGPAPVSETLGYSAEELAAVPEGADLSLGCGAPIDGLALQPGETVLDLGSGPGLDAFLAARRVGPSGRVIGVDMTPKMIERARAGAERGGYANVEFREGRLEALPVEDASIDAITSNCVINLVPDKAVVFREVARVLKPGGRLVISDVVLAGRLPPVIEQSLLAWTGCISGALPRERYFALLGAAGLGDVEVLHDIDFLEKLGGELPRDVAEILLESGLTAGDVAGKVRSVTYRAVKSAS